MKRLITILLTLSVGFGWAQTQPNKPTGAVQYGQLWIAPDGNVWAGSAFDGYTNLGNWERVADSLDLRWTKAQVDSVIMANLADYVPLTQKGASNGVATLDINSKIPLVQIPDALIGSVNYQGNYNAATNTPTLPTSPGAATKGHYYVVSTGGTRFGETFVSGDWIISNGSAWQKVDNNNAVTSVNGKVGAVSLSASDVGAPPTSRTINGKALTGNITLNADDVGALQAGDNVSELMNDAGYITSGDIPAAPVTSVNSKTGAVTVTASDVGLGNVDNTSDANKPISTATQGALDLKEDKSNKATSLTSPNNTTYPTTQAVKNAIDAIEPPDVTGSNGIQVNDGEVSPVYGTTSGTVAQGNDSRINNGQTAFGWGNHEGLYVTRLNPTISGGDVDGGGTPGVNFTLFTGGSTNTPTADNYFINTIRAQGSSVIAQMAYSWNTGNPYRLFFRRYNSSVQTNMPWAELWTSSNFTPPVTFTRSVNGLVPAPGGSGTTRYLREDGSWVDPSTGGGGGTATDLSIQNRTSTTLQVGSSTGTAATIPVATTSLGGLMTADDKVKLNAALTSFTESDPTVPSYVKSITSGDISNWNSGYNYSQTGHVVGLSPSAGTDSYGLTGGNITNIRLYGSAADQAPTENNYIVANLKSQGTAVTAQMAYGWNSNRLFYRYVNTPSSASPWAELWTSSNFDPSNYVTTSNFTWSNLGGKPSAFTPTAHTHNASDVNEGTLAIARIPTGTSGSTVALGNHTHTFASIGAKPNTLAGYGITDGVPTSRELTINGSTKNLAANQSWTLTASDVSAEPAFAKNTAFNKDFGTTSGTVAQGNDSRINNGQTAYGWGDHEGLYIDRLLPVINDGDVDDAGSVPGTNFVLYTSAANAPTSDNYFVSNIKVSGSSIVGQMAYGWNSDRVFYRYHNPASGSRPWAELWTTGNFNPSNYAQLGTGSSQVRNNSQLDARYVQQTRTINGKALSANVTLTAADVSAMPTSWTITAGNGLTGGGNGTANRSLAVGAGDGITVNSTNVAVNSTVVRTSGNQTIGGTKTFSSPVVVANATDNDHAVNLGQVIARENSRIVKSDTPFSTAGIEIDPGDTYSFFKVMSGVLSDATIIANFWSAAGAPIPVAYRGLVIQASVYDSGEVEVLLTNVSSTTYSGTVNFTLTAIN